MLFKNFAVVHRKDVQVQNAFKEKHLSTPQENWPSPPQDIFGLGEVIGSVIQPNQVSGKIDIILEVQWEIFKERCVSFHSATDLINMTDFNVVANEHGLVQEQNKIISFNDDGELCDEQGNTYFLSEDENDSLREGHYESESDNIESDSQGEDYEETTVTVDEALSEIADRESKEKDSETINKNEVGDASEVLNLSQDVDPDTYEQPIT